MSEERRPYRFLVVGDPEPTYSRSASLKRAALALGYEVAFEQSNHTFAVLVPYPGWRHLPLGYLLALRSRRPLVFDYFISLSETKAAERHRGRVLRFIYRMLEKALLLLPSHLIFDTAASEAATRHLRLRKQPSFVVPVTSALAHSIEQDAVAASVRQNQPGSLTVLWYGTYSELHGVETIIEAAAELERERIDFVLVGDGRLRSNRRTYPLNVELRGWMDLSDLAQLVRNSDVMLGIFGGTPKSDHVIPNKVVDGLASGVCVVTQESTAVAALADQNALMTVPPCDSKALAAALRLLRDSPSARESLRTVGMRAYERSHSSVAVNASLSALVDCIQRADVRRHG